MKLYWLPLALSTLLMHSCSTPRVVPALEITAIPVKFDLRTDPSVQIERLKKIEKGEAWVGAAAELKEVLEAEHYTKLANHLEASKRWFEIVLKREGQIAKYALGNWQTSFGKLLGNSSETYDLAQFFWNEKGHLSWIGKKNELDSLDKVRVFLAKNEGQVPIDLDYDDLANNDPLLKKTAKQFCRDPKDKRIKKVIRSYGGLRRRYFNALAMVCLNERKEALREFSSLAIKLSKRKKDHPLAVTAYRNIVDINRYLGDREAAANGFMALMKAMKSQHLDFQNMGYKSDFHWQYEIANTKLWAARYRSMVGDYLNARVFVQEAFDKLDSDIWDGMSLTAAEREEIQVLRAEAYHILASRISFEKNDLAAAYLHNKLGLALSDLPKGWVDRFKWNEGWYQFLSGKELEAMVSWQTLLESTEQDSVKERTLFWLARVSQLLKKDSEFEDYKNQLEESFPLGFYSLYGARYFSWEESDWLVKNASRLTIDPNTSPLNIGPIADVPRLNYLRMKAELALMIKSETLGRITSRELYFAARRLSFRHLESHLYLTRVLYMNHQYALAMGHTTALLSKHDELWFDHPEQVSVYYPSPLKKSFEENARVELGGGEFLRAIARQESAFKADAMSWAGAVGLLQLMPKTAQKYSSVNLSEGKMIDKLKNPSFNLKLASRYLLTLNKRYEGEEAKVAAAYNAGEFVVDRWLKVRKGGNAMRWIESIPFSETNNYVKKVLRNYSVYKIISRTDSLGH